jgi:hypothetical protein
LPANASRAPLPRGLRTGFSSLVILKLGRTRDDRKQRRMDGRQRWEVDLNLNNILFGGFISLIGLALLMYGRKAVRVPHIVVGLVLMIYPYFVGSLLVEVAVAIVLVAGLALTSRLGL